ncbi:hypothetical protein QBC32DRAFT_370961 [Pseudoneurospora amorphoporcata]|uniref:Uncharacterized protein n=1 Tax=Pseudoneurospora amorphoporcata TaxID=241081 RepID=A0AAN6NVB5_9PEZI|nr:hypothetical protein QBC32DRAFT_370961 [Pseudoneurospora amorphoporcata]
MAPNKLGDRDVKLSKLQDIPQFQGESNYRHWESALFFVLTFYDIKKYVLEGAEEKDGDDGNEKRRVWRERMWAYSFVRGSIDPIIVNRLECYYEQAATDKLVDEWLAMRRLGKSRQ